MFPRRGPPATARKPFLDDDLAESDDDTISLTDTAVPDPDVEYVVEGILAERIHDGELLLLVEWADFDKLLESTWEPARELGDDLNNEWKVKKARLEVGGDEWEEMERFKNLHEEVHSQLAREKKERHRRRNAKRKRLGLPLVDYGDLSESEDHAGFDEDSSYDEAVEDPAVVDDQAVGRSNATTPRQTPQQRMFKGATKSNPASPAKDTAKEIAQGSSNSRRSSVSNKVTKVQAAVAIRDTSASSSSATKKTQAPQPPSTGYQGTARKASREHVDPLPKSKAQGSVSASKAAPSVIAKPTGGIDRPATHLKAKKSATHVSGNIFTSGKTRKQRPGLSDVMADASKPQQMFQKARYVRKAQLAGRSKEDRAPDPSKLPLFLAKEGPASARRFSKDSLQSALEAVQSPQSYSPAGDPRRSSSIDLNSPAAAAHEPKSEQQPGPQPRPLKKRKSVRFADMEDQDESQSLFVEEPEKMDIDSLPQTPEPSTPRRDSSGTPFSGLAVLKKPSLPVGNFSSPKTLILGKSQPLQVLFNGLPDTPTARDGLLAHFLALRELDFHHTCLVQPAIEKIRSIIGRPLATGYILPKDDSQALEVAARYLRTHLIGLYCVQSHCHILIYPTRCEEWDPIKFPGQGETGPAGTSEAHLRYYVFDANLDLAALLPPMSATPETVPVEKKSEDAVARAAVNNGNANRPVMMKRLFNFDYQRLLPPVKQLDAHVFFLAIPEARQEALMTLCQWLRSCNPSCQIFCSDEPGSWAAFRSTVDSLSTSGVVIVHEILAWSLARFPNLAYYLTSRMDEYWCLAEPIYRFPMYPSMPLVEEPARPGDFQMTRLFPHRTVVLLTPSFLVSEPRRTAEFFDWFLYRKSKSFDCRLVTAFNIHEYLSELAREKQSARIELKRLAVQKQQAIHFEENLQGLSEEDCKDRFQAATQAAELHHHRERKFAGIYGSSSLVYVDQSIDPNDEQSLVNWFGWWTSLRADQFRNFYVVGSSDAIKRQGSKRGERRIGVPKYSKVTLNDPDAVMDAFQAHNGQAAQVVQTDQQPPHVGEAGNSNVQIPTGPRRRESWSARSRILQSDRSESFADELIRIETSFRPRWHKTEWVLYRYPVSWMNPGMADHYQDPHMRFNRIRDWHSFAYDFSPGYACHTYMGYFYTADEEFDINNPPSDRDPERHPWLAIWRQADVHIRPWGLGRELIIWDPAAKSRVGDARRVTKKHLTFMQRQVVEYILENVAEKRKGAFLQRVWLGGFQLPAECDSDLPIDIVFQFIEACLSTKNAFIRMIPAVKDKMSKAGFRRVQVPGTSAGPGSPSHNEMSAGSEDMEFDGESSEDEDTRIIFHPPRGSAVSSGSGSARSKCTNRLYEAARLAKSNYGRSVNEMDYAFRPTSDWYTEQRAEGRDYSHVHVDSWERIFDKLDVKKVPASSSSRDKTSRATPV
ncbi:chromo domain-containing protein 1 [Cladorrhinum sp. PSN332]|nr:chromo domain-containing protein 1 [Cladorrhinum sp. PSN332]